MFIARNLLNLFYLLTLCFVAHANTKLSSAIPKEHQIIHIPQLHSGLEHFSEFSDETTKSLTIQSQLKIADLIMKNKDGLYVQEDLQFEFLPKEKRNAEQMHYYTSKEWEDTDPHFYKSKNLNNRLENFLYSYGSAELLFHIGGIQSLYSDKNRPEIEDIDDFDMNKPNQYWIDNETKKILLRQKVLKLIKKNPNKKIFFIYGFEHDFSNEFGKKIYRVPDSSIIPKEFLDHPMNAQIILSRAIYQLQIGNGRISLDTLKDKRKDFKQVLGILSKSSNKNSHEINQLQKTAEKYLNQIGELICQSAFSKI